MTRVGLLSLPRYFNYGSQLQLFALQTAIERLGHECEAIDYEAPTHVPLPIAKRLLRVATNPMLLLNGLRQRQAKRTEGLATEKRGRLFQEFSDRYIHLGPTRYQHYRELLADPPTGDAFVVGSDQVWSPLGHLGDDSFYLKFAPREKRVAYAPSLGVSEIPDEARTWMRDSLKEMAQLSVRESRGAQLIAELSGREAKVVVDPTLLLTASDWSSVVEPSRHTRPYLLCYLLETDGYARDHARRIAAANGLDIVMIPWHPSDIEKAPEGFTRDFEAGPKEFLGLIRDAAFVCTDSFHGTVFSTIFRRPFFVFRRYENKTQAATFSRMADLLSHLDLSDRALGKDSAPPSTSLTLDYVRAERALETWRAESWSYLAHALDTVTGTSPVTA